MSSCRITYFKMTTDSTYWCLQKPNFQTAVKLVVAEKMVMRSLQGSPGQFLDTLHRTPSQLLVWTAPIPWRWLWSFPLLDLWWPQQFLYAQYSPWALCLKERILNEATGKRFRPVLFARTIKEMPKLKIFMREEVSCPHAHHLRTSWQRAKDLF